LWGSRYLYPKGFASVHVNIIRKGCLDEGDTLPQGWKGWKQQLEQLINIGETVSLLTIGKVKYEVLAYLIGEKTYRYFD